MASLKLMAIHPPFRLALRPLKSSGRRRNSRSPASFRDLLRPLLTPRSLRFRRRPPFQMLSEVSPGKSFDLHRTTAGSTFLPLGRRGFAVIGPLAPGRPSPLIRFLFIGPRLRSPLLSPPPHGRPPCGSLGFLHPRPRRTRTSMSKPMLGTPTRAPPLRG